MDFVFLKQECLQKMSISADPLLFDHYYRKAGGNLVRVTGLEPARSRNGT